MDPGEEAVNWDEALARVEGIRRKIRPEISSVAEDGTIFHKAVAEKGFLAPHDIRAGEENLSGGIHNFCGDGGSLV